MKVATKIFTADYLCARVRMCVRVCVLCGSIRNHSEYFRQSNVTIILTIDSNRGERLKWLHVVSRNSIRGHENLR